MRTKGTFILFLNVTPPEICIFIILVLNIITCYINVINQLEVNNSQQYMQN